MDTIQFQIIALGNYIDQFAAANKAAEQMATVVSVDCRQSTSSLVKADVILLQKAVEKVPGLLDISCPNN
jgi:hypothetical protein